ncbi:leucine-rich repeat domain-containing protein [Paraeggerthella hongkongensis]|uniref:leucine-rich repeat domain-containing protein n=1 Tax=Paraeggerthella hongkongensis TaxID=230658 RepID=UPI001374DD0B|nr:leucine-rich repeat domain-containing protein [Paraeggerthella hongkongensis]
MTGIDSVWLSSQGDNPSLKVAIPAEVGGRNVTRIGSNAFRGGSSYRLVALDMAGATNVTSIGNQAFRDCRELEGTVDLSNTAISELSNYAFKYCVSLQKVVLPASLERIGDGCFERCFSLRGIVSEGGGDFSLLGSLRSIGETAFYGAFANDASVKVRIPSSVVTVGDAAFRENKGISQIVVDRSVNDGSLGAYSHDALYANEKAPIILPDKLTYDEAASSMQESWAYSFPMEVVFHAENGDLVYEKLASFPLSWVKDAFPLGSPFFTNDASWTLPDSGLPDRAGYRGTWALDGVPIAVDWRLPMSFERVELQPAYAAENPTVKGSDGSSGQSIFPNVYFSSNVTLTGPTRAVGVSVDHPLLMENEGTSLDHVYFKYIWWDQVGSSHGPRSLEEPEIFSASMSMPKETEFATIPISSLLHARTGDDAYIVQVLGYHVENGQTRLFYKSNHNFLLFSDPDPDITTNTTFVLKVDVENGTAYKVEHYRQSLDGSYPSSPDEVENLAGTTGEEVSAQARPYEGFSVDAAAPGSVPSGTVAPDGSLVLKLHYSRNVHQLSWSTDGDPLQGAYTSGPTMFGAPIAPPDEPTKPGFAFAGWSPAPAAAMPDSDVSYAATWTPSAGTAYKVEHYRQSLDGSYPSSPDEVENLAGTTGEEVSAQARPYEGFSVDAAAPGSVPSGTVAPDGSLVLKLHYSRNVHQLSWSTDGDPLQGAYTSGPTMFGAPIAPPDEPTKPGFAFAGWSPAPAAAMPDSDVSYAATWTPSAGTAYKVERATLLRTGDTSFPLLVATIGGFSLLMAVSFACFLFLAVRTAARKLRR